MAGGNGVGPSEMGDGQQQRVGGGADREVGAATECWQLLRRELRRRRGVRSVTERGPRLGGWRGRGGVGAGPTAWGERQRGEGAGDGVRSRGRCGVGGDEVVKTSPNPCGGYNSGDGFAFCRVHRRWAAEKQRTWGAGGPGGSRGRRLLKGAGDGSVRRVCVATVRVAARSRGCRR